MTFLWTKDNAVYEPLDDNTFKQQFAITSNAALNRSRILKSLVLKIKLQFSTFKGIEIK